MTATSPASSTAISNRTKKPEACGAREQGLYAGFCFGRCVSAAQSGAIAQLGERFHGMEEVVGSIPSGSTKVASAVTVRGLIAFPITPADPHGVADEAALRALLRRLTGARVDAIGLLGSTGLYPFFTRAERRRIIEIAADAAGGTPLLVGVGALRTDDAVALAQDAAAAGAAELLLAPMAYTPLRDDEVFEHFAAVARATNVPICVYNNPGTTHFTISAALTARLSRVPNIGSAKHPAPPHDAAAHLANLRAQCAEGFALGYSIDKHATEAMIAGGAAWYSVLGGLFPRPLLAVLAAIRAGDVAQARRLDAALAPVWALFDEHSSLRVMYAAINALGIAQVKPPRPLLPLAPDVEARVMQALAPLAAAD